MPDADSTVDNDDGTISVTYEMPEESIAVVRMAVKLLVAQWYENREAVGEPLSEQPLAVRALLQPLRVV